MKVIIAGSREGVDYTDVAEAVELSEFVVSEVVSGAARGADKFGEQWASGTRTPVKQFPADWDTHGKSAGYIRNEEMAKYADALIAVWDGKSRGTKHMIDIAQRLGLKVYIYRKGGNTMSDNMDRPLDEDKAGIDDIFDMGGGASATPEQQEPEQAGPEKKPCPECGKMLTWTQAGKPRAHKCESKDPVTVSEPEAKEAPKGITVDRVITAYMETKADIAKQEAALDELLKPLKERLEKFLTYLGDKMKGDGVTSINGQLGRSEFYPVTSAKVEDAVLFLNWVREDWDGRKHFLENRVSKTAVKGLMDDGQVPPPGVGYTKIQKVKVVKK